MSTEYLMELVKTLLKESENEVSTEPEVKEIPNDVDLTPEKNSILPDYINTDEHQILPFSAKYSMLNVSADRFIMDMIYLYSKLSKEGKSIEEIKKILLPGNSSGVSDFSTFLEKINELIISRDGDFKVGYQVPEELKKYGDDAYKRYLSKTKIDPKAQISYEFTKGRLTPRGYWQLQFLSRILAGQPLHPEEEVFFIGGNREPLIGIAYYTLRDFYKHAFIKMAVQLAGRFHKAKELTKKDVWLHTDIDSSVDHFLDMLREGKYDVRANNVGAWAFSVMKNKLIDFIKGLTSIKYRTGVDAKSGIHTYDAFVQNKLSTWYSELPPNKSDVDAEDLSEPVQKVKLNTGEIAYQYKFVSPEVAHSYLQSAEAGEENIFKHLTKGGQKRLANMGAKLGVRKYTQFYPDTQTEPTIPGEDQKDEKILGLLEHNLYNQLFDFAFKKTDSFETAFGEKSVFNVDTLLDAPKSQAKAFKVDIGKALFKFLGYFDYTNVWKRKAKGKFDPELFASITADPNETEKIASYKEKFKSENEAMYYALLGWQKGKDWTKLNNVSINRKTKDGEYVGIVDPDYIDENGDIYEELLPFTKTVITRARKGIITKEIESEINADRVAEKKQPFNSGQLQSISSAANQMEELIKTDPKLSELIKRILKTKQQKNQTINEMKNIEKLRSLIHEMVKQALEEAPFGREDSYEMDDFDQDNTENDEDIDVMDQEEDLMDEPKTLTPANTSSNETKAAAQILGNNDPNFIASAIASAEYKLASVLSDELYKVKKSNPKKFVEITDALVAMYQSGTKARQIQNFFANYYLLSGKKFDNSNIRVLLRSFPGVDVETIEDALTDSFMTLLSKYKATGASFDGFVHRVASNAIKKVLTTDDKTTSLDAPLSSKGNKTKGDTIGSEDGEMEDGGDATDALGSTEEESEQDLDTPSVLEKVLTGTAEEITAFKKALKSEAEKYPKWKRYLKAFENIWQKGHSWSEELGNTANWKDYDVLETGKKLLIDYFIEPAIKSPVSTTVQEVKVTKTREGEAWAPFEITKSGAVQGIKNPEAFAQLKNKVAAIGSDSLNNVMNFLEDSEASPINIANLGDPAKLKRIVEDLKAPIIHQLRELGKRTGIEIKKPVSAVRKFKRNVDKGKFSGDSLNKLTNIDEEENIQEVAEVDAIDSSEMDDFLATFEKFKNSKDGLNETYSKMNRLLNGNKLIK